MAAARACASCMMMQSAVEGYDGRKFDCCAPYHGEKGQAWETFVRNFAAAMSTGEVAEESLEDTPYGSLRRGPRR